MVFGWVVAVGFADLGKRRRVAVFRAGSACKPSRSCRWGSLVLKVAHLNARSSPPALAAGIAIAEPCALMLECEWGTEENSRRPRGEAVSGEALAGGVARSGRHFFAVVPYSALIALKSVGYSLEKEVLLSSKIEYDIPRKQSIPTSNKEDRPWSHMEPKSPRRIARVSSTNACRGCSPPSAQSRFAVPSGAASPGRRWRSARASCILTTQTSRRWPRPTPR